MRDFVLFDGSEQDRFPETQPARGIAIAALFLFVFIGMTLGPKILSDFIAGEW